MMLNNASHSGFNSQQTYESTPSKTHINMFSARVCFFSLSFLCISPRFSRCSFLLFLVTVAARDVVVLVALFQFEHHFPVLDIHSTLAKQRSNRKKIYQFLSCFLFVTVGPLTQSIRIQPIYIFILRYFTMYFRISSQIFSFRRGMASSYLLSSGLFMHRGEKRVGERRGARRRGCRKRAKNRKNDCIVL